MVRLNAEHGCIVFSETCGSIPTGKYGDDLHKGAKYMQTSERVVVIKGNASNWYSQAVFILNPGVHAGETQIDFVAEAEKIIFDYMAKKNGKVPPAVLPGPKAKRRFPTGLLLYILMALACVGMAVVIGYGLLR